MEMMPLTEESPSADPCQIGDPARKYFAGWSLAELALDITKKSL
jgi:hypothetical protein